MDSTLPERIDLVVKFVSDSSFPSTAPNIFWIDDRLSVQIRRDETESGPSFTICPIINRASGFGKGRWYPYFQLSLSRNETGDEMVRSVVFSNEGEFETKHGAGWRTHIFGTIRNFLVDLK